MTFLHTDGEVLHRVLIEDSSENTHATIIPGFRGIAIETPEFFLEPNTEYIIRVHEGVAETFRRGCGYLLSEYAEWNFRTAGKTFYYILKPRDKQITGSSKCFGFMCPAVQLPPPFFGS